MAMLLHLSDLHLTAGPSDDATNDVKIDVIQRRSQQLGHDEIKRTLEALAARLLQDRLELDCIVITGDISDKNNRDGYDRLADLLGPLVPDFVPFDRVVVVPGNHDVQRGSASSTRERYENFLTLRERGFLTPLLEGVDIQHGSAPDANAPICASRDGSFVVVALNSSNHSQIRQPPDAAVAAHLKELDDLRAENAAVRALWESWEERGAHDPCWIDPEQLHLAAVALREAASLSPQALRIAALHHQLLPVGTSAEIKTFETMVNLGEVLQWVGDNDIDVVLHGHKHVARVGDLTTSPMAFGAPGDGQRVLLVSSPNTRPHGGASGPVARLLDVPAAAARVAGVRVADLYLTGPGRAADIRWTRHVLDDGVRHGLVRGRTAQDVHRKLMALDAEHYEAGKLLTCVIDEGASALELPATYRDAPVPEAEQEQWFKSTLDWWQNPRKGTAATFNHGERLHAYRSAGAGGVDLDQVDLAAKALGRKNASTRAIAILIDPIHDLVVEPREQAFPAFALVQFVVRGSQLDVVGYFRKQEIPHWWPVNVGELALLQRRVVGRLAGDGVSAGSITTITPQPVRGGSVPRVSVPSLDQRIDEPSGLLQLVLPLFASLNSADGALARRRWSKTFDDWEPQPVAPADGEPMPVLGLERLGDLIGEVGDVQGALPEHQRLREKLRLLHAECRRRQDDTDDVHSEEARRAWLSTWHSQTDEILTLVDGLISQDGASSERL